MTAVIEPMYVAMGGGAAVNFPVVRESLGYSGRVFGFKAGFERRRPTLGVKAGGFWPDNVSRGSSSHQSTIVLFDPDSESPLALVRGTRLMALRTAAPSSLSIRHLARAGARTLGILGAGGQSLPQLTAALAERNFAEVLICDLEPDKAEALASSLADSTAGREFSIRVRSVDEMVHSSDVIVTVTPSSASIVKAAWMRPGTHLACMGADTSGKQEFESALVANACLFVDRPAQAVAIGECQQAFREGRISEEAVISRGRVIDGSHDGRRSNKEITLIYSTGVGLEDVVAARLALERAFSAERAVRLDRVIKGEGEAMKIDSSESEVLEVGERLFSVWGSLVLGLLLVLASSTGLRASVEETGTEPQVQLFDMLQWRSIGPVRGGRSIAAAGSEQRPHEYYFGATGGGLWKTTDSGLTWGPVTDGQIASASVGAIAVAPSNPDVVYIGMGEGQLRANVLQGDGLYRSVDGGATWKHAGLAQSRTVTTIRVHPEDPNLVYVAALGDPFQPNEQRGIFRSRDGGSSWEKILYRSPEAGAIDLAMDPNDPDTLYATIWQVYRKPWKLWSGGPQSGLFKSTDGGDSWVEITRNPGLPAGVLGKMTVVVSPADSGRVYANIEAEEGGLYRSDDGGSTWNWVNGARKLWQRAFYFLQIRADPVDRDTVYVLSFRLEKSTDGGETFSEVRTRHVDIHDLWIDPDNPERMIVADDGGASVSVTGGRTWTEQDYPTAQMYRVATTNDFPYHVCGAQQDNTTDCVASHRQSAIAGIDRRFRDVYTEHYTIGTGEMGYVAVHPTKSDVFFAGNTNGLQRFDRDTGRLQDVQPFPFVVMGQTAESMTERWNWTYPIVFSPHAPHALYVASQHVWRSGDDGRTWEKISPDLTRADPATLGETGGPIMLDQDGPEVYATLYSLAISPLEEDTIWAGSDDGLVHVTRDGGQTWTDVTPTELPPNSRVSSIDLSSVDRGTAYIAAKRYEMGDRAPYAWKTVDYGRHWSRIDGGLADEDFVHVVRSDPERTGLLYAGTEHGVRVSFDDGQSWQSLSLNLPSVPVFDLQVKGNELVIATFGRSFHTLRGVSTLRQVPDRELERHVRLFAPGPAYRPVVPAAIDFHLHKPAKSLSIVIRDPQGERIRQLIGGREFAAGAHRVFWDLRYDGATTFPGMILESPTPAIGPLAVPGKYRVELVADDIAIDQPITVIADPRLQLEPDDYEAQLALALRARDASSTANQLVIDIREFRESISRTAGDSIEAAEILHELAAVEAELYQVKNESPKDKIAYPIKLNDRLAGLQSFLTLGSGRPTQAQYEVFEMLSAHLAELRTRFDNTISRWHRLED